MPTLREVLASPALRELDAVVEGDPTRQVEHVAFAESLDRLGHVPPEAFVLLSSAAAAETGTYRFDVALRRACGLPVTAIAMPAARGASVPATAAALAARGGVTILRAPPDADLGELASSVDRAILAGAEVALDRIEEGLMIMREAAERPSATPASVVAALASILPGLAWREPNPGELGAAIRFDGIVEGHLALPSSGGQHDRAAAVLVHLAAAACERLLSDARRAEEVPVRSRSELLTELLASDPRRSTRLWTRARSVGLVVDGWHVVGLLEIDEPEPTTATDAVALLAAREAWARAALDAVREDGGTWHLARVEPAIALVRIAEREPGPDAISTVVAALRRALERVTERAQGRAVQGGVGDLHMGPAGLRASTAEARAALGAARATGAAGTIVTFDAVGIDRTLAEWYASDAARETVRTLLGPLERLGPGRADTAIRTLQTFLDEQGSVTRTARALFLHRNAVAYRMKRIAEVLEVDLDEPDQRLALQLACRARTLATSPTTGDRLGGSVRGPRPRAGPVS